MPYDRPQGAEIETILAVAEKIAKRTNMQFVVDNEKRDAFIRLSVALSECGARDEGERHHRQSVSSPMALEA